MRFWKRQPTWGKHAQTPLCCSAIYPGLQLLVPADTSSNSHEHIGKSNNALHTAVKLGRTEILPLLVEYDAGLPHQANAHGLTPLALGEQILRDWSDFTAAMHDEQVRIPDRSAYVACIEYLHGVNDNSQE